MSHPTNHHASEDRRPGIGQLTPEQSAFVERVRGNMAAARQRSASNAKRPRRSRVSAAIARRVRELHAEGWSDPRIAREIDMHRGSAQRIRARLNLPALHEPVARRAS